MQRRSTFLVVVVFSISSLAWWTHRAEPSLTRVIASMSQPAGFSDPDMDPTAMISSRREALEVLDRIVSYERYYHSLYGHFTKFLNRIGLAVPKNVSDVYEIRIVEASERILVVSALSEL